jgi:hypothetical protein
VFTAWITDLAGSRHRAGEISLRGTGESSRQKPWRLRVELLLQCARR